MNPVNTVGVSGRGLAWQFRNAFPKNYSAYHAACSQGEVKVGNMFVHMNDSASWKQHWIVNFPTKRHWRDMSRMEDIESGLQALKEWVLQNDVQTIAVPQLGCGLGGLAWREVLPLVEAAFSDAPTCAFVYG